jgi:hypothetical protein
MPARHDVVLPLPEPREKGYDAIDTFRNAWVDAAAGV